MEDQIKAHAIALWGRFDGWMLSAIRIVLIVIVAWIVARLALRAIRLLQVRVANRIGSDIEVTKRAETLGRVFRYLITVVICVLAGMLILSEVGISVAPILGAAGVVGLAVGFGAQSLVKDYFTGFFILLENQIRQGDVVKLGNHAGAVEEITLRYVQLRDYDGNVHFVPNGTITTVINMTRGFAQAAVAIKINYTVDIDRVLAIMRKVGKELRATEEFKNRILDDLEIAGVDDWTDSSMIIKARFKVLATEQWGVKREFLRRLKYAFDAEGIPLPTPPMTVQLARQGLKIVDDSETQTA